jgi:putative membrane protein
MRFYFSFLYEYLQVGLILTIIGSFIFFIPDILSIYKLQFLPDYFYIEENQLYIRLVAIGIILMAFILSYLRYRFSYLDLNEAGYLYYRHGIINVVKKEIPVQNITDFKFTQNIFEKILGVETLIVNTSGTSSYELLISGVPSRDVQYILEFIRKKKYNNK